MLVGVTQWNDTIFKLGRVTVPLSVSGSNLLAGRSLSFKSL